MLFSNCLAFEYPKINEEVFSKFSRSFSVLYIDPIDLSSLEALSENENVFCLVVVSNKEKSSEIIQKLDQINSENICVLQAYPKDCVISKLFDYEYFDVVIFDEKDSACQRLKKQGLSQFWIEENHVYFCNFDESLCPQGLKTLETGVLVKEFFYNNCLYPKRSSHKLLLSFDDQTLVKPMCKPTPWKPGINFVTFKLFGGIFPNGESFIKEMEKTKWWLHSDPQVINILVTGKHIQFIDFSEESIDIENTRKKFISALGLAKYSGYEFLFQYHKLREPTVSDFVIQRCLKAHFCYDIFKNNR